MSGIGEASLVLGIISSIIAIVTAAKNIYDAANDASGLPKSFHKVAAKLPIVVVILKQADDYINTSHVDEETRDAFVTILRRCGLSAKELHEIFVKVIPKLGASRVERYLSATKKIGQGSRVEDLMADILKEIELLLACSSFASQTMLQAVEGALADVPPHGPPLPNEPVSVAQTGRTLHQLHYDPGTNYGKDQRDQDPQAFLSEWLLPKGLLGSNLTTEHDIYLQKRFRNSDTGYDSYQWFFETSSYQKFIEADSSKVLKIKGSPGCGKSILTASIIHNLQTSDPLIVSSKVLYFYCNNNPNQTSSMTLVRTFLAQILDGATPEMILQIKDFQSAHPILKASELSVEEGLWRLLRVVLGRRTEKTFIIVDGFDDCTQPLMCARHLVKVTASLASKSHCGLLLSSRMERREVFKNENIMSALARNKIECCELEVTRELIQRDLTEFISYQVSVKPGFLSSSQTVRDKIVTSVCDRAQGMFLFASLAIEDLEGESISSIADIDDTLAKLPVDLHKSYERKIQIPRGAKRGPEAIRWIYCAMSSLTWPELRSALAIKAGGVNEDEVILDSCHSFLQHSCGPLVESFGDLDHVRFIHTSVTKFLHHWTDTENDFDIRNATSIIASKLITFLEYPDLPSFASPILQSPERTIREYSTRPGRALYAFAVTNWFKYLKRCAKSQDSALERQVHRFLNSNYFVRWIKTAVIMSRVFRDGQDSASLTADVVDSLQSWMLDRPWTSDDLEVAIHKWINNFLDLMLDWGKVIEIQPDWIHYLYPQLLSTSSCFRDTLEGFNSGQSIIQFIPKSIGTKRSEPITWPERCITMDLEKNLAFTYDEPFIACYNIRTGLMITEVIIPIPPRVRGPLVLKRGVLSSNRRYLAVQFEAVGPSTDPVAGKIRAGRRLHLNIETTGFKWGLDDPSITFDVSGCLANMAIGVDAAEFVVCLLELNHTGPARTHLLAPPSWATTPVLVTGSQSMRWDLDDIDVLKFSDDSQTLMTPFGIFDLESGKGEKQWEFALSQLYEGGKVTADFKSFVTVMRDLERDCVVQFFNIDRGTASAQDFAHRVFRFPGVIHLLAVSNHGRFLLLTKRERLPEVTRAKSRKTLLPAQQASIGVFDCRDREWTPLLLLDRESVNRLQHWDFLPYTFRPQFSPEAIADDEVNKVFFCAPSKWKLSGNVRKSKSLNPRASHLLLFESKQSTIGFGKNPSLKVQLPTNAFSVTSHSLCNAPKFLGWNLDLSVLTVYERSSVHKLGHEDLERLALSSLQERAVMTNPGNPTGASNVPIHSSLLISSTVSAIFHIQVSVAWSNSDPALSTTNEKGETEDRHQKLTTYVISVGCFLTGADEAKESISVTYSASSKIGHSIFENQLACAADDDSISLGVLELDISQGYDNMSIDIKDLSFSTLRKAVSILKTRVHPLAYDPIELSAVGHVDHGSALRYVIFEKSTMELDNSTSSIEGSENNSTVTGETCIDDSRHVFQFSRKLKKQPTGSEDTEAGQFELCLFIYDENLEDITWMAHTTTGGTMSKSVLPLPETAWALERNLPLLAWITSGHRLRLSNIKSHAAPIVIAESISPDIDSAHCMSFSPEGRFIILQAQEEFKNDLMTVKKSSNLWGLILCDLQAGKTIGASLISKYPITITISDPGDVFLHTYRLTREGAVEDTTYTLPGLVLTQRQYLTFLPAGCRCSTCGNTFDVQCHVSVIEHEGGTLAIIGHTRIGNGKAPLSKEICLPLMVQITTPPVELNIDKIRESVFMVNSIRLFPPILDHSGMLLADAFAPRTESGNRCAKLEDIQCFCRVCSLEASDHNDSVEITWIPQMETKISDFKLPSGLAVPPEQIEELHRLSQAAGNKHACFWESSMNSPRDTVDRMKRILGDEVFPWDSWAEFKEAMEEIKEVFDIDEYTKRMFEPGNCGIGCQIPLFVHTFQFGESGKDDFHWSSSTTTGWLEEDLAWFYERSFGGAFEGARRWYDFPAYKSIGVKMDKLKADKTEKGKRFRRYFGPSLDKHGKPLEIELPENEGGKKDVFVKNGIEYTAEMKPLVTGLIFKDVFDSMSDLVPGLGKIFEQRMHTMLEQSLIEDMLD